MRKQITMPEEDIFQIESYSKKLGKSFSEFLRIAAKKYIEIEEEMELSEYLKANCDTVSQEEEEELLLMLKDYDPSDKGRKIALDEILQSSLSKKSR